MKKIKRTKLSIGREVLRHLDLSAARGGVIATEAGPSCGNQVTCASAVACPTYRDITCASDLASCMTQPTYCP